MPKQQTLFRLHALCRKKSGCVSFEFYKKLTTDQAQRGETTWGQLQEEPGEIHLIVSDSGTGFDIEAARQGRGLGPTSMQERVRLVNGTIAIESKPMAGTTIHVRVRLSQATLKSGWLECAVYAIAN